MEIIAIFICLLFFPPQKSSLTLTASGQRVIILRVYFYTV